MKIYIAFYFLAAFACCFTILILNTGCANIIPPGGGPKDTLPPVLIYASPKDSATNFAGDRIMLGFDEYVDLQNTFENIVVSPLPVNVPVINYNFRTVSIKIKDTLQPNTTYSINFGNALRDINEGNVLKNFTYVFSTGSSINFNKISGRVVLAETGKTDSTLIVVLHRNTADSAILKEKPVYLAKVDSKGRFQFNYLPAGRFAIYAIPNDYSRHYDDTIKPFAFADSLINTERNDSLTLYAYSLPKNDSLTKATAKTTEDKKTKEAKTLKLQPAMQTGRQDLLTNLEISYNLKIARFDSTKILLTDTNYNRIQGYEVKLDTAKKLLTISYTWPSDKAYKLLTDSTLFTDSTGKPLTHSDTLKFFTKKTVEYGSIRLQFKNIDLARNPVLLLVQNDKIVESSPLTQREWYRKLINPGDYEIRILYDKNKNGIWDPGRFTTAEHRQPEIVTSLNTKLSIRANWDNEKDITL